MLTILLCLLLQDAEPIQITLEESMESKQAYANLRSAIKQYETISKKLSEKYTIVPCILNQTKPNPETSGLLAGPAGKNRCYRTGFENGFKYTRNFGMMIPDLKHLPGNQFDCWKVRP